MGADAPNRTLVVVYRLYGHYSLNARDGGEKVSLLLEPGYVVSEWIDGNRLITGPGGFLSIEQAIYNGFARILQ